MGENPVFPLFFPQLPLWGTGKGRAVQNKVLQQKDFDIFKGITPTYPKHTSIENKVKEYNKNIPKKACRKCQNPALEFCFFIIFFRENGIFIIFFLALLKFIFPEDFPFSRLAEMTSRVMLILKL